MRVASTGRVLVFAAALGLAAACSSQGDSGASAFSGSHAGGAGSGGAGGSGSNDGGLFGDGSLLDDASVSQGFDVQPSAQQTLALVAGQPAPSVAYAATLDGKPIGVGWSVDRAELAAIGAGPAASATVTATGGGGGVVSVRASLNGQTIERSLLVTVSAAQDGANTSVASEQAQVAASVAALTEGGGVGGVGGEGLGGPVADAATLAALAGPADTGASQALAWLYPYDATVWPRGLLAPLLQWSWAPGDADAVRIELATTSGSYAWVGTFARPAILAQTGAPFTRHPIPQDVWEAATASAAGKSGSATPERLRVRLTVARGGVAYGPIEETWTVAPARLSGIIYYNSYGTRLAKNFAGAVGGDGRFGGAVLSIHVGDTAPQLVAGADGGSAQCRVCHSVAADGSRLVVQHGDSNGASSAYDLTPSGSVEHPLAIGASFPGVYPDGSRALSTSGQLLPLPDDSTPLPVSGLDTVATSLGTPAFSPDGALVAFNPMAGPGVANPTQKLVVMEFDAASGAFSNPVEVVDDTGQPAETRPGWPAFFPDGKSIVFHHQSAAGFDGNASGALATRKGARARIAWTGATAGSPVHDLDRLNGGDGNGGSALPKLATPISLGCGADGKQVGGIDADHGADIDLNYEPTVNPVASGGYAWVVFTSRRLYGNVATIPPFCSDPRGVDLVSNVTTKKLWVAAVDVSGQPGTDPSHPAFYVPAQELLAGNARAFWVLDPCRADGTSCQSGDQCCNGFCEPDGEGGGPVCSGEPPGAHCSAPAEHCDTVADCCDPQSLCINGFCAQKGPH